MDKLRELIEKYSELFKNDFYVSQNIPEGTKKAIDIGGGRYIIFKDNDIESTVNDRVIEMLKQKDWFKINDEEYEEQWEDTPSATNQ